MKQVNLKDTKIKKGNNNHFNQNVDDGKQNKLFTKIFKEATEWAICIIIAFVVAVLIKYFLGTFTTVKQASMYPTLKQNDKLWLNRTYRTFKRKYNYGDIVVFESPEVKNIDVNNQTPQAIYNETNTFLEKFYKNFLEIGKISYIKRVIALPGDHVKIENNNIYINSEKLEEKYLNPEMPTVSNLLTDFIVPENHIFLMGDNRTQSTDCRFFGCIPLEKMEGKISFRISPFDKIGNIPKTFNEIKDK